MSTLNNGLYPLRDFNANGICITEMCKTLESISALELNWSFVEILSSHIVLVALKGIILLLSLTEM